MKCPHGQFDRLPGMKFCGQCGAKLGSPPCPQCGAEVPPGSSFAVSAGLLWLLLLSWLLPGGAELHASPIWRERSSSLRRPSKEERKQVTVLFCDLVGSTALADRLGPETMHLLLNRFFELALWGGPLVRGDDQPAPGRWVHGLVRGRPSRMGTMPAGGALGSGAPQAAGRAGGGARGKYGVELTVRMELNTGGHGRGIGDHLRRDYTAIGDTTNDMAKTLESLAGAHDLLSREDHEESSEISTT
jgi:hypothetical protein